MFKVYTVKLARVIPAVDRPTVAPKTIQVRGVRISGSGSVATGSSIARMSGSKAIGSCGLKPGQSVVVGSGINRVRVEYVGNSPLLSEFKVTCWKVRSIKATKRTVWTQLHTAWDVLKVN